MSQKNKKETETNNIHALTDSTAISELLREEKAKLLEISLDITMGKEKNNQLKRAKKKKIARLMTRLNQLKILTDTPEVSTEMQTKEQE